MIFTSFYCIPIKLLHCNNNVTKIFNLFCIYFCKLVNHNYVNKKLHKNYMKTKELIYFKNLNQIKNKFILFLA